MYTPYHVLGLFLAQLLPHWSLSCTLIIGAVYWMEGQVTLNVLGGLSGAMLFVVARKNNLQRDYTILIVAMGAVWMQSHTVAFLATILSRNSLIVVTTLLLWVMEMFFGTSWPDLVRVYAFVMVLAVAAMLREEESPPDTKKASPETTH